MIFDTDILSMLCKIGRIDLLRKLFPGSNLIITFEVFNENGVVWLDIVDIMRLCYLKHVLDKKEIEKLITDIEEQDMTKITRKERIFADVM